MVEIRLAEQQPPTIPIPPFAAVQSCALAKKEAVARQRKFSMELHIWIKQHRHLRVVDVDCASVALLLLPAVGTIAKHSLPVLSSRPHYRKEKHTSNLPNSGAGF